jgi:protein O-mannosyl-transferase
VAAGVALAHLPGLGNGFVWDDLQYLLPGLAPGGNGLPRSLTTDFYLAAGAQFAPSGYYRPVAMVTYWLSTVLGSGPFAFHLSSLVLHAILAGLLALLLARRLGPGSGEVAALAAALWACHPEQVEVVSWISCRFEILTGMAAVGFLLLPWRPGWRRAVLHGLIFLAGLLSKEGFLAFLGVVLADDWAERRRPAEAAARWLALATAVASWLGLRAALNIPSIPGLAPLEFPRQYLGAVATYLGRALSPVPLSISHPFAPAGPGALAAGVVVVAALLLLAIRRRQLAVPVALFLAMLAPMAIASAYMGNVAERYFYVPSLGLAWLLGAALVAIPWRRAGLAIAAAALAVATTFTVARQPDWKSDRTIFGAAAALDPEDAPANLRLGILEGQANHFDEARRFLGRGLQRAPQLVQLVNAQAWLDLRSGHGPEALALARKAVALAPEFPQARFHLAGALHLTGDHQAELTALDQVLAVAPGYREARISRALARCELERNRACEDDLHLLAREGVLVGADTLVALAEAALRRGDLGAAATRLQELRATRPDDPRLAQLSAVLARRLGSAQRP